MGICIAQDIHMLIFKYILSAYLSINATPFPNEV